MAIEKAALDAYLGADSYDNWLELNQDGSAAQDGFAEIQRWMAHDIIDQLAPKVSYHMNLLQKSGSELLEALTLISAGKQLSKDEVDGVRQVYAIAITLIEYTNEILKVYFSTGLVAGLFSGWLRHVEAKAQETLEVLAELKKELEQAEREETKGWIKTVLSGALTVVTFVQPQVGMVLQLGAFVLEETVLKDEMFRASVAGTTAAENAFEGLEIVTRGPEFGKGALVLRGAGTAAEVVGVGVDFAQGLAGSKRAARLEDLVKRATRQYNDLRSLCRLLERDWRGLRMSCTKAIALAGGTRSLLSEHMSLLEKTIQDKGYWPSARMIWEEQASGTTLGTRRAGLARTQSGGRPVNQGRVNPALAMSNARWKYLHRPLTTA